MKFMILMSDDPSWDELTEAEQANIVEQHDAFETALQAAGALIDSARFGPDPGKAVLRRASGKRTTIANPRAGEGAIGGYYLIDVPTIDDAVDWAERCRFITGTNWVYPVWE